LQQSGISPKIAKLQQEGGSWTENLLFIKEVAWRKANLYQEGNSWTELRII
jgi:hypothetical protein